jgi:hypothetical protein
MFETFNWLSKVDVKFLSLHKNLFNSTTYGREKVRERERDSERENKVYLRITVCIFFHPFL